MRLALALIARPVRAIAGACAAATPTSEDAAGSRPATIPMPPRPRPSKVPLDEIRRYVAVYNAVKEAYVEPVDDKKLMQSAIRGLLLDLDPHSAYLDKEDADAFDEQTTGAYDGVGVELLQQPDGTLRVIAPIDDTPAAQAGIKAGDVIIAIDGKPISGRSDGMEPLRGEPGSKVMLTHRARRQAQAVRRHPDPRNHPHRQRAQPHAGAGLRLRAHQHVPGRHRRRFPAAAGQAAGRAASCAAWCSTCAAIPAAC